MRKNGKKVMVSTMIASFVLSVGIAGAIHNSAYADEANSSAVQKQDRAGWGGFGRADKGRGDFGHPGGDQGGLGGGLVKETAAILGVQESNITADLKEGKTLVEIVQASGLSEADYLQKLIEAETTAVSAKVTAGVIQQEQADKMIAGLTDRLTKQIENSFTGSKGQGSFGGKGGGRSFDFGGNNLVQQTATILGVEKSDVEQALKSGKTLAAFADEKGLAETDYLQKLVAAETSSINAQVEAGKLKQEQADKIVSGLSERLTKQIEGARPAGGPARQPGGHGGLGGFLPNQMEKLSSLLGVTLDELKDAQKSGKSIADIAAANGIGEDELITKMKDSLTDSLKKFVESKHTRPENKVAGAPAAE